MNTQYTVKQIQEFTAFANRHGFTFGNNIEFMAAIDQYFKKD
jgi:hypothetical protein